MRTGDLAADALTADFAVLRLPVARLVAGLTVRAGVPELAVFLGPALVAPAGLMGAFVAAAMAVFLFSNDCGRSPRTKTAKFRLGHRRSAPA